MIRKVLLTALCVVSFGIAQAHRPFKRIVKNHLVKRPAVADTTHNETAFYDRIPLVNDILGYAKKYLSSRYRSGGSSPRGFDCSGFTRFCFSKFGITLPHSSAAQSNVGVEIEQEVAKPGDLIFFKGHSSRSSSIGHVGMIVEIVGDRIKFIHSAWNGGVRYDWLHASYYQQRYVGIRRVVHS
ncbi:C40 family peptidase [Larkinella terrae]|uniref:NlpC/P60 family protein n=1 Tax=Larkinella terrae TaxID=2025311 RepID=A0A7K0EUL4_9BACT|nr:NlpC/P60 family protein [Larkinella terrae]